MDTLHRFISTLNIEFGVDFLNRNVFQYLDDGAVKLIKQGELKTALQENKITSKTLFFDKLVDKLDDLRSEFFKTYGFFLDGTVSLKIFFSKFPIYYSASKNDSLVWL